MKQALLDSCFILSCVREKIDFFQELELMGILPVIPQQVIKELKAIKDSKKKLKFRQESELSLTLLEKNKFKKINLDSKKTDSGIIKFANQNPEVLVATLDKGIQDKIRNKKIILRGRRKLEIV